MGPPKDGAGAGPGHGGGGRTNAPASAAETSDEPSSAIATRSLSAAVVPSTNDASAFSCAGTRSATRTGRPAGLMSALRSA
jgi:hypothetical protein